MFGLEYVFIIYVFINLLGLLGVFLVYNGFFGLIIFIY